MEIQVVFTTQLKAAVGADSVRFQIADDATPMQAVQMAAEHYSDAFSRLVFDSHNALLPSILLCVNDQQVDPADSTPLSAGDTVTLLSAISGG